MLSPSSPFAVERLPLAPFKAQRTRNAAHRDGLRYEMRVRRQLLTDPKWQVNEWFAYRLGDGLARHLCSPDAYCVENGPEGSAQPVMRIAEVKVRWCLEAVDQLKRLYLPVLSAYVRPPHRALQVHLYCVCRHFDPAVPGSSALAEFVESLSAPVSPSRIGIVQWSGK